MARSASFVNGSRFVVAASVCVTVAALYVAQQVLIPLTLAVLLSFLPAPLVRWLGQATAADRVRCAGSGRITATLAEALDQIH